MIYVKITSIQKFQCLQYKGQEFFILDFDLAQPKESGQQDVIMNKLIKQEAQRATYHAPEYNVPAF